MRDTAVVDAESQKAEAIHRLIASGLLAASATVVALGRAVGNRRLARLIAERRLARRDTTGIDFDAALGARPAEEARLAGEAQRIAGARYLSAPEVTEVGVLTSLRAPTKEPAPLLADRQGRPGAWRNIDHTSNSYQRRGGLTDWGRVYRVDADAAMQQAAAAQIKAAREAPAPEPPPAEPTPVGASPGP